MQGGFDVKVHAVLPEVGAHGGIQRYNRLLIRALDEVVCDRGGTLRIFSLNDQPTIGRMAGFARDHRRFVSAALAAAWRDRPDVVLIGHVNLMPLALVYRVLAPRARIYGVAYGVEVESRLPFPAWLGMWRCSGILAVSQSTRHLVTSRQHIRGRHVHLLSFGFDSGTSSEDTVQTHDEQDVRLLSVARLEPDDRYKGIDTVIQSIALLRSIHPNIRYTIIGDGPDRPRLICLAQELDVANRVAFRGNVSDEDLEAAYRETDIFVLPSTHEGFGIVYLEAMAHGKPVIGVRAGGVADVIVHEVNGLLTRKAGADAVADAIARLIADPALRARLGAWGRAHTVPQFSSERMVHQLRQIVRMDGERVYELDA
ncbi:MAG: hypothetical protein PVSMB7_27180 [Chloroflexota bacterium]